MLIWGEDKMALMTLPELAEFLRVTEKTIYRLIDRGMIPATKVGRQWRFDRSKIEKWLGEKSTGGKANILVVDDEEIVRALIKETLEDAGHKVTAAETGEQGLKFVKEHDFDLIFLDLKMPRMDGAELFRQIKRTKPESSVIIITGYPDSAIMARALAHGPFGVIRKPFNESDILLAVKNFIGIIGQYSSKKFYK